MKNTALVAIAACISLHAAGCGPPPELADEVELHAGALRADTRIVTNFNGDRRYVRLNDREVKLFLTESGSNGTDPRQGFWNDNHFDNSCGPTAAMNVFKWYGIIEREGKHCFWLRESPADVPNAPEVPPIWVCQDRVSASRLGQHMQTNTWRMATIEMPGTRTDHFRSVFADYLERHKPDDLEFRYGYRDGDGLTQYNILWAILAQGHPVVVNYKTGATKGHFATIVGIEKVGNDDVIGNDKIYLANGRQEDLGSAISYGHFRDLWRRDYHDFGALSAFGEERYTRLHLWDGDEDWPVSGGGGGTCCRNPPRHQK